jgi:glycosyltransferase involved in cell wall biosynthesis
VKILELIPSLESGGAERLVVDIANEFSAGNDVIVVSLKRITEDHFYSKDINSDVRIISLKKAKGFKVKVIWKLFKTIKKEKPDIVHSHLASTFHYLMFCIPFFKRISFFHTLHSIAEKEERHNIIWLIRKVLIKTGRLHFICISDSINRTYKERVNKDFKVIVNGRPQVSKTELFGNVVEEMKKLRKDEDTRIFLSVGRLTHEKNHELLIDAFKESKPDNAVLLIIGKDYSEGFEKTKLLQLRADDNTYFLGEKSNISDYMLLADAFCLSSVYEGMPITIIEAFSAGLPVISTAVGGVVDMIEDNVNGFLAKNLSVNAYREAFERYSRLSKDEIKKIKEANFDRYQKEFTIRFSAESYLQFFRETRNTNDTGYN